MENALYKRALGYDAEETKVEVENGKKKITRVTKHVPPDVTAAIFWLKNRKPGAWRDKPMPAAAGEQEVDLLSTAFRELEALADEN